MKWQTILLQARKAEVLPRVICCVLRLEEKVLMQKHLAVQENCKKSVLLPLLQEREVILHHGIRKGEQSSTDSWRSMLLLPQKKRIPNRTLLPRAFQSSIVNEKSLIWATAVSLLEPCSNLNTTTNFFQYLVKPGKERNTPWCYSSNSPTCHEASRTHRRWKSSRTLPGDCSDHARSRTSRAWRRCRFTPKKSWKKALRKNHPSNVYKTDP